MQFLFPQLSRKSLFLKRVDPQSGQHVLIIIIIIIIISLLIRYVKDGISSLRSFAHKNFLIALQGDHYQKSSHLTSTIETMMYSKCLIYQNIGRWMNGHEPTPNPSQEGNKLTAQVENFRREASGHHEH